MSAAAVLAWRRLSRLLGIRSFRDGDPLDCSPRTSRPEVTPLVALDRSGHLAKQSLDVVHTLVSRLQPLCCLQVASLRHGHPLSGRAGAPAYYPTVRMQRKRFHDAVDVRRFPHGRDDVVELDDLVVGRMTYEPGWPWSTDIKPIAGTEWCTYHHLGVSLSGRVRVETPDGTELEIGPGDVFEIPPGHDAWVVGDEPWVSVDFEAMRSFGRGVDVRDNRSLATILFTDIVDSTAVANRIGDARWKELVAQHNEQAQAAVDRHRGRVVKWTGDGMLAVFDGAERAARCALLHSRCTAAPRPFW